MAAGAPPSQPPSPSYGDNADVDEVKFQEAEADLRLEDLLQMKYEVNLDEDEGAEGDLWPGSDDDDVDDASDSTVRPSRKAAILLELLSVSGADLDAKLVQFRDDVDAEMLGLLQQRLDMARTYADEYTTELQHLETVYRALRLMHERNEASPAMRLLDDVLDILGDPATVGAEGAPAPPGPFDPHVAFDADEAMGHTTARQAYQSRRREAAARMRSAFTGGASDGVDIFAAAAALAAQGPIAADELGVEHVALHVFVGETTELLGDAKARQRALGEAIARAHRETEHEARRQQASPSPSQASSTGGTPPVDSGRRHGSVAAQNKLAEHVEQLKLARMAYNDRQQSITQLEDVLFMARAMGSSVAEED